MVRERQQGDHMNRIAVEGLRRFLGLIPAYNSFREVWGGWHEPPEDSPHCGVKVAIATHFWGVITISTISAKWAV